MFAVRSAYYPRPPDNCKIPAVAALVGSGSRFRPKRGPPQIENGCVVGTTPYFEVVGFAQRLREIVAKR
jgi:hypothetical protein